MLKQHRPMRSPVDLRKLRLFLLPMFGIMLCSILLLLVVYVIPIEIRQDIGLEPVGVNGLHDPEHNHELAWAYSTGRTTLQLPQLGSGQFEVTVRMGGVQVTIPVRAQLIMPSQRLDLGVVKDLRVYHVLLPSARSSDVELQLASTTTQVASDARRLGALLDWIALRSVGVTLPPPPLLLSVTISLALLGIIVSQLGLAPRWKSWLFLCIGTTICLSYLFTRGRLALDPWWWLLAVCVVLLVVITLQRVDAQSFATPLRGVATIFVVWRAALWLIAAVGIFYSAAINHWGQNLSWGGAIAGRATLLWDIFAAAWMRYDSHAYQMIALEGYSFYNERWPTITFFPLYPLLIRVVLPVTFGNAVVAALLVSHLALFAALLMLYHLLANQFGAPVAYRTLVLLLMFPSSFFFVTGYSESLALALLVGGIWALRRQHWWLAGALGFLLALTRLPGVLFSPILVFAYLQQQHWRWREIRADLLAALLPPLGLALFMAFQWWQFGTPFAFMQAQANYNNHLNPPWGLPLTMLYKLRTSPDWPILVIQLVVWPSFLALLLIAVFRLPALYTVTMGLLLVPPYLQNWPWSLSRHVLLAFPAFIVMALITERRSARKLLIAVMLPLLVVSVLLFVNDFWIA